MSFEGKLVVQKGRSVGLESTEGGVVNERRSRAKVQKKGVGELKEMLCEWVKKKRAGHRRSGEFLGKRWGCLQRKS